MSGNSGASGWFDSPWLRGLFAAVQFLTRLPVPGGSQVPGGNQRDPAMFAQDLRRGLVAFPLVGAGIGAMTAVALCGFSQVLPFAAAVLAALAFEAILTGAFHEDAVADFCDAFGDGWTADDVLRILKDSRVGSFGVVGLGLAMALRVSGLIATGSIWPASVALVVSGALGRLVVVAVMAWVPPVSGRQSLSRDAGRDATWRTLVWATLLIAPIFVFAARHDLAALVSSIVVLAAFIIWLRWYLLARIGGVTGDCLGFAAYAGIVITTLAFARL